MSLEQFLADPWKISHSSFETSPFNIRPAPEFATAEVIVASLYRAIGFAGHSESDVPKAGREFDKLTQRPPRRGHQGQRIDHDTWRAVLHGMLESPKQPNQSSKRFLQLTPLVPDAALYSGSARLSGNSWNPGILVQRMIRIGASTDDADKTWNSLFAALSVNGSDDIWARWLQQEFGKWKNIDRAWEFRALPLDGNIPDADRTTLLYPAKQFVRDLDAIILAKNAMTRRQWVTLLESILRLGCTAHILWLSSVNHRLWRAVQAILTDAAAIVPSVGRIREDIISQTDSYLGYGNPAVPQIKDYASRYLSARLGLNVMIWNLEKMSVTVPALNSAEGLQSLLTAIRTNKTKLLTAGVLAQSQHLEDSHARTIACKKGIGSNLAEFGRHALGRRQTASQAQRGYDQGYILRKRGEYSSAPWIVSLGPVAVLALVHCCLRDVGGPRSIHALQDHLQAYGINVHLDDIANSDLGRELRMLGLVLDSPDAESGMLLVPPFSVTTIGAPRAST